MLAVGNCALRAFDSIEEIIIYGEGLEKWVEIDASMEEYRN